MSKNKTHSQVLDLLIRANQKYSEYRYYTDKVAKEAQKYISWSDDVNCEYIENPLTESTCIRIDCAYVPVEIFFDLVFGGVEITEEVFWLNSIH